MRKVWRVRSFRLIFAYSCSQGKTFPDKILAENNNYKNSDTSAATQQSDLESSDSGSSATLCAESATTATAAAQEEPLSVQTVATTTGPIRVQTASHLEEIDLETFNLRIPRELGIHWHLHTNDGSGVIVTRVSNNCIRIARGVYDGSKFWVDGISYVDTPRLDARPFQSQQDRSHRGAITYLGGSKDLSTNKRPVMTSTINVPEHLTLPRTPKDWQGGSSDNPNFKALGTLSPPVMREIQPFGPHYLAYARRKRHGRTFSEDERIQAQEKVKKVEDEDDMEISEDEDPIMLQRDAKDWKEQDHYAVLGLKRYRYKATPEQIKKAHRKKVLKHHPDKKAAAGKGNEDDSFFKCIQKSTETLLDPVKRRQWDSVDPEADVEPPSRKEAQKGNWFKLWRPVFEAEARFSNKQPVPGVGTDDSTKEEVEEFYNFWYDFDSWRTFGYLDEDVPDDNENRDHKRHVEKKNANARRKRKTEDTARLRKLVDDALATDERIKKFQKQKSQTKNKKKTEKEAEAKRLAEEQAKAKEEEARKAKEQEEANKSKAADAKKAKEAAKNAVKKNKRVLKGSVKDVNYFAEAGKDATAAQVDKVLDDVDFIQGKIDPDELADLASKLNIAGKDGAKVKSVWDGEAKRLVAAGKIGSGDLKAFAA